MSVLEVRGLTMRFGGLTAVNAVDFSVAPRQIFAIIGPNGAGKTTVFNAVTGVYEPSAGDIRFEGRPIRRGLGAARAAGWLAAGAAIGLGLLVVLNVQALWDAAINANYVYRQPFDWGLAAAGFARALREQPWNYTWGPAIWGTLLGAAAAAAVWQRSRRTPDFVAAAGVARTFQNIRLFPEMTVLENVLVGMHTRLRTRAWHAALRLPRYWREQAAAESRARAVLEFAGLGGEADRIAESLSYGHQRRLEIARALAGEPRLLLLDEPAAGMNPSETEDLMELIRKVRDRGVSILLIEHDMKLVMGVSDRIAVLDYGNKIAEGTPAEVRADPKVTAAYLGAPEPA